MVGGGRAISVSTAVLFLWSLTELGLFLPLSLFTFKPILEVAAQRSSQTIGFLLAPLQIFLSDLRYSVAGSQIR